MNGDTGNRLMMMVEVLMAVASGYGGGVYELPVQIALSGLKIVTPK